MGVIFKNADLRGRVIRTVLLLLFLRIFYSIPTPGVNLDYFKGILDSVGTLGIINAISGGGLSDLSLMTLSVTPYITASIVMQLMGVIFPKIHEAQRGMKDERRKVEIATYILGGVLALVQGIGMAFGFGRQGLLIKYTWYWALLVGVLWCVFALVSTAAGALISEKKEKFIGNGISLILFVNIASTLVSDMGVLYDMFMRDRTIAKAVLSALVILICIFGVVLFTVYLQESEKRLRVANSRKVAGGDRGNVSVLPIRLCVGGVVPIIFAGSVLGMPVLVAQLLGKADSWIVRLLNTSMWFNADKPVYTLGVLLYVGLIVMFTYFYGDMIFNPYEVANNLKKQGGSIIGVRAGKSTEKYIRRQVRVVTGVGAVCLSVIAAIPIAVSGMFGVSGLSFLGTSAIILVGVVIDMSKILNIEGRSASYSVRGGGII